MKNNVLFGLCLQVSVVQFPFRVALPVYYALGDTQNCGNEN